MGGQSGVRRLTMPVEPLREKVLARERKPKRIECPTCGEDREERQGSSWGKELWCPACKARGREESTLRRVENIDPEVDETERVTARGHRFNAQLMCVWCARLYQHHTLDPRPCPKGER